MMKRSCIPVLILFLLVSVVAFGQQQTQTTSLPAGFRGDFLRQMDEVQTKMSSLGDAIPADKYAWRPEPGVRSISEVYVHVAMGNFLIPQFVGIQPPAGITPDMEKTVTDRAKALQLVQQSFDHVKKGVLAMSDKDLEKPASFYGDKTTVRDVLFRLANHMHEHLGQLIAYARMNKIVPPWSAPTEHQP